MPEQSLALYLSSCSFFGLNASMTSLAGPKMDYDRKI